MRFLGWLEDEPASPPPGEARGAFVASESNRVGEVASVPNETVLRAVRAAARERLRIPGTLSTDAGMEILEWNLARGADPTVESSWRALLRGEGVAVVTGQQPALLGGPLYSLYKLLTAIELAAELERSVGCPALAVFWVVGDDADFGEVSSAWLPGTDGLVRRLRDSAVPPGGTMIGSLSAVRQRALLDATLASGSPGAPGAPESPGAPAPAGAAGAPAAVAAAGLTGPDSYSRGRELVEAALTAGGDWSGSLAALAFRLLPGVRFLFVDGAHPAIVREQTPWIREAVETWPLGQLLREGEAEARAAGFEPALDLALAGRAAFRITGTRREVLSAGPGDDMALGPNVVLRPLLQDRLLPNAATVCGPSEIRYRAQLGPVYLHAGVPRPPLVPRLRAALLPPGRPDETMPPREALQDPDAYLARRTDEAAPAELLAQVQALRAKTREDLTTLGERVAAYDPGLPQLVESAAGKADFQLQRIHEAVLARTRQRLLRADPRLARWREFVRPRDGEQERALSLLSPMLLDGPGAVEPLREAARAHLRRLEAGQTAAMAVFGLSTRPNEGRGA